MINMDKLNEIFEHDDDAIKMILGVYIEEHNNAHQDVHSLYEKQSWEALCHLAHSLFGILTNLCENDTSIHIKNIEVAIREGGLPNKLDITRSISGLSEVQTQIESHLY